MPITYKGGSNNPEKRTTMQYSQQRFKGLKGKIFREIQMISITISDAILL